MISYSKKMLLISPILCALLIFKNNPSYSYKKHSRSSARHIQNGGIGYNKGYTTFEAFLSPKKPCSTMPFVDIKAHVFNDGKAATNVGIGAREIIKNRVYGVNAYYDYRRTERLDYNQLGIGLETLGEYLDFRVNGYIPICSTITSPFNPEYNGFVGNEVLVSEEYQFAMPGVNADLGLHFEKNKNIDLYTTVGGYYFHEKIGRNALGVKGSLRCNFKEYFTLEISDSYDKVFHNRFQYQFSLTIPFGTETEQKTTTSNTASTQQSALNCRMLQPIKREEIIVVGDERATSQGINPATGKPFKFIFVDNTSNCNGTYESPYSTLASAQSNSRAGDIIYVFPGDGTTTGMNAGITLKPAQKFWGSGVTQTLHTTQGDIAIPALTGSSPQITSLDGDGITLASNNQVRGFTIKDAYNYGISGSNITAFDLSESTIESTIVSDQIHIENTNTISSLKFDAVTVKNGSYGIVIQTTNSPTTCTVNNSTFLNNEVFLDSIFTGESSLVFTNNVVKGNGASIIEFRGTSSLLATNNQFNNNTTVSSPPLSIKATSHPFNASITNNTFNNNTCGAIRCILHTTPDSQLTIADNVIQNNGIGSQGLLGSPCFIYTDNTAVGNCILNIENNTFTNNTGNPLYCYDGSFDSLETTITRNTLNGNGGGFSFASSADEFILNATHNSIVDGNDNGISTANITLETADITISNNRITGVGNASNGIIFTHNGTTLNATIENNIISDNESTALIFYPQVGIENMHIILNNNTMDNNLNLTSNASSGIDIEQFENLTGSINNNSLSDNANPAVFIGSTLTAPTACISMSGNDSDIGYTISNPDDGTFDLAPCDIDSINEGEFTFAGEITMVQSCDNPVPCA